MKSSVLKWYMFAFLFISEFLMFAQDPGDTAEDENGNPLEGGDPEPTGINSKLFILAIFALVFSVAYFRKQRRLAA